MTTNVIMHSNVIQIDRKCNKTGKCYPNRISSTERRNQYKFFRKIQFFTAFNQHGAPSKSRTWEEEDIFLLHSTQSRESAAFPSNTAALINFCLSNLLKLLITIADVGLEHIDISLNLVLFWTFISSKEYGI